MIWIVIACVCAATSVALLIVLFMTARRCESLRAGKDYYEANYGRAVRKYSYLCHDYVSLLSCEQAGFIPKRLRNRNPKVNEVFPN